ncbi:MAG TPA: adenylate/guanylate cyclase domain-containing protein, partial [Ardenticatenaceae bacterium]|nr:adenylate/guanylate cyclase domain-containing protein [Ardenticatenaceae bacterium]
MPTLPTGTVTFLFTDIEGSTRLWEQHPEAMKAALARHDLLLRQAIERHGGGVVKTTGDGVLAAFATVSGAVHAALDAQRALYQEAWPETGALRVRMALHTGTAEERGTDYFGPSLNRAARLMGAGHGGQILLSLATQILFRDALAEMAATHPGHSLQVRDLGEHRLKDLSEPERIFQLVTSDLPSDFPPLKTLNSRPNNIPPQPTALVGRERETKAV